MGWFDEQIKIRKQADQEVFEDTCLKIAGSVMGHHLFAALNDEREQTKDAIGQILKFYNVKVREVPENLKELDEILEYLLRPYGIMTREVTLHEGWRKDAFGAMLTSFTEAGKAVALIPSGSLGYKYLDPATGVFEKVTKDSEKLLSDRAMVFYKPFPNRQLKVRDIVQYIYDNIDKRSLGAYLGFAIAVTAVGMLATWQGKILFSDVISIKNDSVLLAMAVFMICTSVSGVLFQTVQGMYLNRISLGLRNNIEAATMMRLLSLPSSFFKKYAAGDLANRVQYMNLLVSGIINMGMVGVVSLVLSFAYVIQIYVLAPALGPVALLISVLSILVGIAAVILKTSVSKRQMELESKENGMGYAMVAGIEKIKLSGAERRAFARWGKSYSEQASYLYNPPFFVKVSDAIVTSIPLIGAIVIYYVAIKSHMDIGQYYAFFIAYGMMNGALEALSTGVEPVAQIGSILDVVKPIMETTPEVAEDKPVIEKLSGGIELTNVTFRYSEDMPAILDNVSLKIRPGQYVAITGKTGCGKSTMMRLMLGFETPQKGAVYYDGKDLARIDLKSLRSKIGTVLQNGTLFMGDIYSNIAISAPWLTLDEAWEAAEMAGIADDIREMPMGMATMIAEGAGGISGGQKQRLMIARAIAPKPKILMFDEATSALDNITQKQISDALGDLKCTRVVIAHRLSTIRQCDRIIVLDEGRIAEDGTYDELMAKDGLFTELVRRQQVGEANE